MDFDARSVLEPTPIDYAFTVLAFVALGLLMASTVVFVGKRQKRGTDIVFLVLSFLIPLFGAGAYLVYSYLQARRDL